LTLTAARSGEVTGAVWDEINLSDKVWVIPADRMKADKEHRVPLSGRAVEILKSLPREAGNPHVFIGAVAGKGLGHMAMASVLERMGCDNYTVHGFRSTFMDWAHETTAYPKVVIDMALAHAVGDKVEAAYRRGDLFLKRTRLMADWQKFIVAYNAVPYPPTANAVVTLRTGTKNL
jgi:integrase